MVNIQLGAVVLLQLLSVGLLFQSIIGGGNKTAKATLGGSSLDLTAENDAVHSYDRLVIFLVDALRADMVSDRPEMRFARSLIQNKALRAYVSRAHAPTVTLPRLKALMSGGVPQFLDLLTNLGDSTQSSSSQMDSLISRLKRKGKRLVLNGDDTWLKLYPGAFLPRSDGTTSSFFTPDFVEVDANVSRHIDQDFDPTLEDKRSRDWDVEILHYLGLDHVGHQLGPDSPRMAEKLEEMDAEFSRVYRNLAAQDLKSGRKTLLVLISDHGMNNAGNHGGSSLQEVSAVTIFAPGCEVSPRINEPDRQSNERLKMEESYQVDISPTLGLAMGVGIPQTSVGCVLEGAFTDPEAFSLASETNRKHLLATMKMTVSSEDKDDPDDLPKKSCADIQRMLLSKMASEDVASTEAMLQQTLCLMILVGAVVAQIVLMLSMDKPAGLQPQRFVSSFLAAIVLLIHVLSLGSSSAIENEHATVFHLITSVIVLTLVLSRTRFAAGSTSLSEETFVVLCVIRLMRSRLEIINFSRLAGLGDPVFLNQGTAVLPSYVGFGQDWLSCTIALGLIQGVALSLVDDPLVRILLNVPIGATWSLHFEERFNFVDLLMGVPLSMMITSRMLSIPESHRPFYTPFIIGVNWWRVLIGKTRDDGMDSDVDVGAVALYGYLLLGMLAVGLSINRRAALLGAMIGLSSVVCRKTNLPVLSAGVVGLFIMGKSVMKGVSIPTMIIIYFLYGWAMFFAMGNSHSVSTIDIAGGYIGSREYNRERVALITAFVVYTGPLLACQALLAFTSGQTRGLVKRALWLIQSLRLCVSSIITVAMQSHLFIWSVFAPRFGYELLWTVCLLALLMLDSAVPSSS